MNRGHAYLLAGALLVYVGYAVGAAASIAGGLLFAAAGARLILRKR